MSCCITSDRSCVPATYEKKSKLYRLIYETEGNWNELVDDEDDRDERQRRSLLSTDNDDGSHDDDNKDDDDDDGSDDDDDDDDSIEYQGRSLLSTDNDDGNHNDDDNSDNDDDRVGRWGRSLLSTVVQPRPKARVPVNDPSCSDPLYANNPKHKTLQN